MEYIAQLKLLLSDIIPISSTTTTPKKADMEVIGYKENPLNPNLLSYCFDNILGFDVKYRVFEKVNYEIEFDYKGTYGFVAHHKMSFNMQIHAKYKSEIIDKFTEARKLLTNLYLEFGTQALDSNEFTMDNECFQYHEKISFYVARITELEAFYEKTKNEQTEKMREIHENKEIDYNWTVIFNEYQNRLSTNRQEQLYMIESYIDTIFAYLEHVVTLLYPFTPQFDLSKSYSRYYIHNPRWTWDKKLIDISNGKQELLSFIDPLREIKEIYRNRNAHGMFSRELKVYVQIDGFGRYPMYIGKNYLKGFIDDYTITLQYKKFLEIKDLFDNLMASLRHVYEIPMLFIEGGPLIPVDVALLTKGVFTKKEAQYLIEKYHFDMDNQINMDW